MSVLPQEIQDKILKMKKNIEIFEEIDKIKNKICSCSELEFVCLCQDIQKLRKYDKVNLLTLNIELFSLNLRHAQAEDIIHIIDCLIMMTKSNQKTFLAKQMFDLIPQYLILRSELHLTGEKQWNTTFGQFRFIQDKHAELVVNITGGS